MPSGLENPGAYARDDPAEDAGAAMGSPGLGVEFSGLRTASRPSSGLCRPEGGAAGRQKPL